jgi:colanic acid/amylovoran biosynthesis glycosyltransferase
MKLAVVVDTFPRWSERFIARELQELARRGVDFSVFCLKAGALPDSDDADFAGLEARRVVLPSCIMPKTLAATKNTDNLERRRKLAQKELGLRGYAKVQCASVLAKLLRDGKFSHVYAHFASLPSTIGWLAAAEAKLRLLISAHARDVFVDAQLLEEKLNDCARLFVCNAAARDVLSASVSPAQREKVTLMHHGLPLDQFQWGRHSCLPKNGRPAPAPAPVPVFLSAARFVPKKGLETLLTAAAELRLESKPFRLVLLGEGLLEKKLRAQIKKLNLGAKVEIHPPAAGAELKKIFAAADLFLAPFETDADGDRDGVPNTILEAFALGVPVIGTAAGGLGEILSAETGTVVPEKNPAQLAEALARFLDSPQGFIEKTKSARKRIERDYDIHKNIAPLLSALEVATARCRE